MGKFCPECGRRIEHCQGVEECASFVNFIEVKEKQDQQWEEVIKSLNCYSPIQLEIIKKMRELFLSNFAIAKIVRYVAICKKNPKNRKYFFGWVCRTLNQ